MQKERPRGVLTEEFYSLEKYRHSLEKSGYAYFFLFLWQFYYCSSKCLQNGIMMMRSLENRAILLMTGRKLVFT